MILLVGFLCIAFLPFVFAGAICMHAYGFFLKNVSNPYFA